MAITTTPMLDGSTLTVCTDDTSGNEIWRSYGPTPAAATAATNRATIAQRLVAHRTQLLNWIAANPSGAVLTAAQTLILAQMLIDLTDVDLGLLADTTGT